jgi:hypothetical protein
MDQQFLEREKELFKLNAKLNAKSKKIAPAIAALVAGTSTTLTVSKTQIKTVQIHTANNNFNYYDETQKDVDEEQKNLELMCKKINITNQPAKKSQEIAYPFFNRQTSKNNRRVDIHMPSGSLVSDGNAEEIDMTTETAKTESGSSIKNASMITKHSDDSSAIPPVDPIPNLPLPAPPNCTDIIPKCIEKKISNDGLLKYASSHLPFYSSVYWRIKNH